MRHASPHAGILVFALSVAACSCGDADGAGRDAAPGSRGAKSRSNVVLIVVDTLRRDHLSCYGYARETSPNIDALARDGVRYERAVSQAPWTSPSIGALLTSQFPSTIGVTKMDSAMPDEAVLLSEVLRENGYRTAAVVSHSFCGSRYNFHQGFDEFDESNVLGHGGVSSEGVSDRAIALLEDLGDGPFFLWLHYFDPHFAYVSQAGFEFPAESPYDGPVRSGMKFTRLNKLTPRMSERDVEEVVRLYDSEIAYTDHHIGRVLDRLRELALYDDALIVFTADHGEEFKDHGLLGHTKTLYQEVVGVPLIVKVPGVPPGVVHEPVALVDVFPTVLHAQDLPLGHEIAGRSLLDDLAGERFIFSETSRGGNMHSVLQGRWKLIRDLDADTVRLYDLAADPAEEHDVAGENEPRRAALEEAEAEWLAEIAANAYTAGTIELSPEERARLDAMGYTHD